MSNFWTWPDIIDPAGNERYLGDIDHKSMGVSLHSVKYQTVLDFLFILSALNIIEARPDDEDRFMALSAKVYKRRNRLNLGTQMSSIRK